MGIDTCFPRFGFASTAANADDAAAAAASDTARRGERTKPTDQTPARRTERFLGWVAFTFRARVDAREREHWQLRFKEEWDCSSKCVRLLGGVINQTNQIVCL